VSVERSEVGAQQSAPGKSAPARMRRAVPLFILGALGLALLMRPRARDRLAGGTQPPPELAADEAEDGARETPDIRAGAVAAAMAGFFIFLVVATMGLFAVYQWQAHGASLVKVATFAAPRLQTLDDALPEPEIARQRADLDRSGWLDVNQRVFQISIDEAMRLVAARGARAYDPVARQVDSDPRRGPAP
jgi:heme exporter protein D